MSKMKVLGAVALAGALIAGCKKEEEKQDAEFTSGDPNEVMVSVNGKSVKRGQIDEDVRRIIAYHGERIPEERRAEAAKQLLRQMSQNFMLENALVDKAKAEGFTVTDAERAERKAEILKQFAGRPDAPQTFDEFLEKSPFGRERALEQFEKGLLIDKMIRSEAAKLAKDYDAEAAKIIAEAVSNNNAVAASEADALKKIKDIQSRLAKSTNVTNDFAEIAKTESACPSSAKGGDLGEFGHGAMVKEFDEVAFSLPVGKVSEPVKTQFGYHLILVTGKTAAEGTNGVEKVRASHILVKTLDKRPVPKTEEVVQFLKRRDENMTAQQVMMKVVSEAKIETCDELKDMLPPPKAAAAPVEPAAGK